MIVQPNPALAGQDVCPEGEGAAALSPEGLIMLQLPTPPSANGAWVNLRRGGRAKSKAYCDWESAAGWKLRAQRPPCLNGPAIVMIGVDRHSAAADIDNRIKLLLDLLVTHQVLKDDKHVTSVVASWNPPGNQLARVMILPPTDGLTLTFHSADPTGATGGWILTAPDNLQKGPAWPSP
jgi:Holliday junction resolvase RusA-like endonuclease